MKVVESLEKVKERASRGEKNDGKHKTLPCIERFYFCNLHQQAQNFIKWGYCPFLSENKVFKYLLRCGTLEISGRICSSTVFWSSTRSSLGFLSWKRTSYAAIYESFMQFSLSSTLMPVSVTGELHENHSRVSWSIARGECFSVDRHTFRLATFFSIQPVFFSFCNCLQSFVIFG